MPKTPEYFIARKNKRKTLEKYLPEDIQLIYGSSINPAKWNFGGELMARRELRTEADQIFYGALSKYRHRKSTDEDFENLGQETLQNKKEVSFLLITGQQLAQGLESYANNGRWSDYTSLLVKMAELGKATGQQLAQGLERCANNGRWDDYTSLLVKMAELGKKLPDNTGQQLAQGLERCANNGQWGNYALLLVKMAEMGKATGQQLAQGLERCANNGRWDDYTSLLVQMAKLAKKLPDITGQQLAQGLERFANNGRWDDYAL